MTRCSEYGRSGKCTAPAVAVVDFGPTPPADLAARAVCRRHLAERVVQALRISADVATQHRTDPSLVTVWAPT